MSAGKRYKFNGSTFQAQTGFATAKTITGITNADPAVVTAAAHGLALGDVVKIENSMQGLDDLMYPIDNPETNDFELAGSDSTAYPAFSLDSPNTARADRKSVV